MNYSLRREAACESGPTVGEADRTLAFRRWALTTTTPSSYAFAYLEIRPLLLDLLEPRLHRRERGGIRDAVDEQERVRRGDRESAMEEQTKG